MLIRVIYSWHLRSIEPDPFSNSIYSSNITLKLLLVYFSYKLALLTSNLRQKSLKLSGTFKALVENIIFERGSGSPSLL